MEYLKNYYYNLLNKILNFEANKATHNKIIRWMIPKKYMFTILMKVREKGPLIYNITAQLYSAVLCRTYSKVKLGAGQDFGHLYCVSFFAYSTEDKVISKKIIITNLLDCLKLKMIIIQIYL